MAPVELGITVWTRATLNQKIQKIDLVLLVAGKEGRIKTREENTAVSIT